ncbi:hypothetical protein [Paenibacillus odorifer]|uniref:hypothetical protein n=1 Tax=Paenibacillus odorifer TaxID=189426 RepID=UPI00096EDFB1|nr:hypothetical protein [Paenibacillus odorifer]OME04778.1 hypothetical protein BSK60_33245 [Paenibacillus odorifer]
MPGRQSQYSALRHQNEMSIIPNPRTGLMGQTNPFEMTVIGMEEPANGQLRPFADSTPPCRMAGQ